MDGFLFLFSFTDRGSFDDLPNQISRMSEEAKDAVKLVVGTKYPYRVGDFWVCLKTFHPFFQLFSCFEEEGTPRMLSHTWPDVTRCDNPCFRQKPLLLAWRCVRRAPVAQVFIKGQGGRHLLGPLVVVSAYPRSSLTTPLQV